MYYLGRGGCCKGGKKDKSYFTLRQRVKPSFFIRIVLLKLFFFVVVVAAVVLISF